MAFKGTIIRKINNGLFLLPIGKMPMMEKKFRLSPADRLPNGEYTGEPFSKMNDSTNIS
jgi:hypothetical protein